MPAIGRSVIRPEACRLFLRNVWKGLILVFNTVTVVISNSIGAGGSVVEWLACWTQAQKGPGSKSAAAPLSGNSLKQTVHTHCASVHQAAKLIAALLRVAGVTAGLAESNGSLPQGL